MPYLAMLGALQDMPFFPQLGSYFWKNLRNLSENFTNVSVNKDVPLKLEAILIRLVWDLRFPVLLLVVRLLVTNLFNICQRIIINY